MNGTSATHRVERVALPDSTILLDYMIHRLNGVLQGLPVYPDNMKRNMSKTVEIIASQRVLLALVGKGWRREDAYKHVQGYAMQAWLEGVNQPDGGGRRSISERNSAAPSWISALIRRRIFATLERYSNGLVFDTIHRTI